MLLSQFSTPEGTIGVAVREGAGAAARRVPGAAGIVDLATRAIDARKDMAAMVAEAGRGDAVDLEALAREGRLLAPVSHTDPAHIHVTGTGLTHLGSASTRDAMHTHEESEAKAEKLTDSMRMFRMGLEGGKPKFGETGVQPEWFYKGNGTCLVAPGAPLESPAFGKDAGEEPEIAGIYLVDPDGIPRRIGFALANEFSDHVMERENYLYLAHSKLRPCAFGPELLVGELPHDIAGTSRIRRDGAVLWEKPFLSGEANMSHTLANLEHHHFKYAVFRQPGDLHVHMFGTATLSFADGIATRPGDVFEIECETFGLPLANPVAIAPEERVEVVPL
ncbi:AraD1 family protein [Pararhizobium mangrovi]|uniref:GguC protein n=1 Tax=Pararhizobium mangrovi TaxID=2590452 RepID=A0A506TYA7_9HYPH|nr:AraD1 family protein [Pararhizobium mangrovi]TPW26178.1 GguC protein [Pararhizobium mangrovi]